ncbi:ABC transporter substrate-binding protein [Kineococcus sp. SYSU DK003]|uniref:ABC transporter substrate-binding protein n=1 Tax=Kineococcus sp. SYSU DK003 TaxID=3383124 RepID=UPI003D7E666B
MNRRNFTRLLAGSALLVPGVAACGSGSSRSDTAGVRYAWWGDSVRQKNYTAALKVFTDENPDISVEPEFSDYDGFQERITVQMAGRNVPELFWVPSPQVLSYQEAGLYRTVDDLDAFDLSAYPADLLDSFKIDGQLNAMPRSVFSPAIRWNQTFLDQAGAQLPAEDDASWTWDTLHDFLLDFTANNPAGLRGAAYGANNDMCLESWIRQHGGDLWSQEGRLGFEPVVLEEYLEWWETLRTAGAALSLSEQEGPDPEWSVVGEKVLLTFANSNHIVDEAEMFPDYDFQQRQTPVAPDATPGHRFLYPSRIGLYARTAEDKLEDAAKLLNFTLNDPRMIELVGMSIGAPSNPQVLEAIRPTASPSDQKLLALVDKETAAERRPRYEAPPGSGTWRTITARGLESLTSGATGITDTVKMIMSEIDAELGAAQ